MGVSISSGVVATEPKQIVAGTNVTTVETDTTITINATGGGSSTSLKQVTLDFGTVPVYSKAITFNDVDLTAISVVTMTAHATSDELEMDGFSCAVKSGVGNATAYIQAIPGPVTGTRIFNYLVG